MCVRASVVLMQCTLAHHVKFVRASCVNFHTLSNSNQGQIRSNLISHVFILNTNFNGHQFLVAKSALNGRNATVFALRFCGPPSWMRERVRSRIKSRPSGCTHVASGRQHEANFLEYAARSTILTAFCEDYLCTNLDKLLKGKHR